MMRGVVFKESLIGGDLPDSFSAAIKRQYPYFFDGQIWVKVIELYVRDECVPEVAFQLSKALLPRRFYSHLVNDASMLVIFPGCIVQIPRGDINALRRARDIGEMYSIPPRQMRFDEMFSNDHPDSLPPDINTDSLDEKR